MRRAIIERDRRCRFAGCDRRPEWCDIDHMWPWEEGGPTAVWNGLLQCRFHHRAKRRDGWWPTLHADGTVTWTHADGRRRIRTDPAPTYIDDAVHTLLDTADNIPSDHHDAVGGHRYHESPDRADRAPPDERPTSGLSRHPPSSSRPNQGALCDCQR
jgi:hypothetical protein